MFTDKNMKQDVETKHGENYEESDRRGKKREGNNLWCSGNDDDRKREEELNMWSRTLEWIDKYVHMYVIVCVANIKFIVEKLKSIWVASLVN